MRGFYEAIVSALAASHGLDVHRQASAVVDVLRDEGWHIVPSAGAEAGLDGVTNTSPARSSVEVPAVLTVDEAAMYLRISRGAAYEGVRTGAIPSVRFGRTLRVPRAGLDALLGGGHR